MARPTIGYTRDNFGRGFYGGSAIAALRHAGRPQAPVRAYVNGRITEALVECDLRQPRNRAQLGGQHRARSRTTSSSPASMIADADSRTRTDLRHQPAAHRRTARCSGRRYYPLSRFQRFEFGLTAATSATACRQIFEPYDPADRVRDREPRLPGTEPAATRASSSRRSPTSSTTRCRDTSDRSTAGGSGCRRPRRSAAGSYL